MVRTFGLTFSSMQVTPPAVAGWHQLVYAQRGVLTVRSEPDSWVVPPHRAMWVPAGVPFVLETSGEVALRALYIHQNLSAKVPRHACAVNVSPLLREVVLRAVKLGALRRDDPIHVRLAGVLLDELEVLPSTPLQLPMPRDPLAARLAQRLAASPADDPARIVRACGASKRTIERLFAREVGMSFGRWVQRLRLLHALQRLAAGETVTAVALDVGYASPSAFVAMFRRELGVTPKRYFGGAASSDARCVSSSGGRSMGNLVSRAYRPRSGREEA